MAFRVSNSYPVAVREFLQESAAERQAELATWFEALPHYFEKRPDGKTHIECIMNSPNLTSEPDPKFDSNKKFMEQVEMLFRDLVTKQLQIEQCKPYSSVAVQSDIGKLRVHDAWVIGAKLPDDSTLRPFLSMGDSLVARLVESKQVRHVWSTSRSSQSPSGRHTHFGGCDLNAVSRDELLRQMREIQSFRAGSNHPLVIFYIFGNTSGNSVLDGATGKSGNYANIGTTSKFLEAACEQQWLRDESVRFVVVSSFHCSPERTGYNDRLQLPPSEKSYACQATYQKALQSAKASAGLLEYTSSKFASAAMFVSEITDDQTLKRNLKDQVGFVEKLHRSIDSCPYKKPSEYNESNAWVLNELANEIQTLDAYVDRFYEDTAGDSAYVCRPEVMRRLQFVKIPFSLTAMIARRAPRISVSTKCLSLHDAWMRTRGRLGWAISPETGAAWMQAAAARMDALHHPSHCKSLEVGRNVDVFSNHGNISGEVVDCNEEIACVENDINGQLCRRTWIGLGLSARCKQTTKRRIQPADEGHLDRTS